MQTESNIKKEETPGKLATGVVTPTPATPERRRPYQALQHRDYRLLLSGQVLSQIGSMMQVSAVGWQIYLLTHDAFQLGLIGVCRVGPLIVCSILGGSAADSIDRRRLLLVTQTLLMLVAIGLATVTMTGIVNVFWIYGLICISSAISAFDSPAYSALIPSLVPRDQLTNALTLNTVAWQFATIIGPAAGGVIIATLTVQGAYWINAISFVAVITALLLVRYRPSGPTGRKISIALALEGLRFVFSRKILISTMLLDFFATFFSSATTLLPIFATTVLHADSTGFGLLSAATAVGAVVTSIIMATLHINRFKEPGKILLVSVFFYALFTIAFGYSTWLPLSILCLMGVGASDTVSMVLRQTIAQLVTPNEVRGRMQSVNMIFFMGGPQLGEVEAGAAAQFGGAPFSVITGGIACAVIVVLIAVLSRPLRKYEFD